MATSKTKKPSAAREPRRPERKWSLHAGINVAVWVNSVPTEDGQRYFRTVTVSPRRYRNKSTGTWEDSGSYRASDLQSVILALQAAVDFVHSTPLPGQPYGEEELVHADVAPPADGNGDIPF